MFCLDSTLIKFQDHLYMQKTGIVTGENNSVTIANIALHYIVKNIHILTERPIIFRRFIDDIICIAKGKQDSDEIKSELTRNFGKYDLQLTFREVSTSEDGKEVEFLDVLHCTNHLAEKGFVVKDFVKPTAVNATFLHGKSAHPSHTFKGIILGEGKRLRRLNENDVDYKKSIDRLNKKCKRSKFDKKITKEWITKVMEYENVWTKNRNIDKSNTEPKERKIPWATSFGHILKTKPKQKALVPQAMVTFRRPPTLGNLLTNYKNIAMDRNKNYNNIAKSSGCGRCGLCGNFGSLLNMVKNTNIITTSKGTTIKLKQHLTCRSYGIFCSMPNLQRNIHRADMYHICQAMEPAPAGLEEND